VVQKCSDHARDPVAYVGFDGSELVDKAFPVDRSEQLALDVADLVETRLHGGLDFDVE
jgi:hypothetical protein